MQMESKQAAGRDVAVETTVRRYAYWTTLSLALAQIALVLVSWLATAAMPEQPYHSLLSVSGVRWFFGSFTANMLSPWLVYIVLMTIAWGSVYAGGLWRAAAMMVSGRGAQVTSQQSFALKGSIFLLALEAGVMVLLTALPHAVLVSITGDLFPSAFSSSIIPTITFMLTSVGVVFGLLSGRIRSVYDVGQCMCAGSRLLLPVLLLYLFAMLFFHSFCYVLGL